MARGATKASGNVWYQARIEAAKWNDNLSSRCGAADLANMSEDAIKNTELGLEKCMPVDKAVILSDLYNAPNLLNYYCLNECPIGRNRPLSDKVLEIDRITVKLIKELKTSEIEKIKDKLIDIADDGLVDEEELKDLEDVSDYLDEVSMTISELRILVNKMKKMR